MHADGEHALELLGDHCGLGGERCEVAARGLVEQQWQPGARAGGIAQDAHRQCQFAATELFLAWFGRDRVGEAHLLRSGCERGAQGVESRAQITEGLLAVRHRCAIGKHLAQRGLGIGGESGPQREPGRHHAVQHYRAHPFRMTAHLVLRHPRAVGSPVEVDARVA